MKTRLLHILLVSLLISALTAAPKCPRHDASVSASALSPKLRTDDTLPAADVLMRTVIDSVNMNPSRSHPKRVRIEMERPAFVTELLHDGLMLGAAYVVVAADILSPLPVFGALLCVALTAKPLARAWRNLCRVLRDNLINYDAIRNFAQPLLTMTKSDSVTKVNINNATELNQSLLVLLLRAAAAAAFAAAIFEPTAILVGLLMLALSVTIPMAVTLHLLQTTRRNKPTELKGLLHTLYYLPLNRLAVWHGQLKQKALKRYNDNPPAQAETGIAFFKDAALENTLLELSFMCDGLIEYGWENGPALLEKLDAAAPEIERGLDDLIHAPAVTRFDYDLMFPLVACVMISQWRSQREIFGDDPVAFARAFLYVRTNTDIAPFYRNANAGSSYGLPLLEGASRAAPENNALLCGIIAHENAHIVLSCALPVFKNKENNGLSSLSLNEMFAMLASKAFVARYGLNAKGMDFLQQEAVKKLEGKNWIDESHSVATLVINRLEDMGYEPEDLLYALFSELRERQAPLGSSLDPEQFSLNLFSEFIEILSAA